MILSLPFSPPLNVSGGCLEFETAVCVRLVPVSVTVSGSIFYGGRKKEFLPEETLLRSNLTLPFSLSLSLTDTSFYLLSLLTSFTDCSLACSRWMHCRLISHQADDINWWFANWSHSWVHPFFFTSLLSSFQHAIPMSHFSQLSISTSCVSSSPEIQSWEKCTEGGNDHTGCGVSGCLMSLLSQHGHKGEREKSDTELISKNWIWKVSRKVGESLPGSEWDEKVSHLVITLSHEICMHTWIYISHVKIYINDMWEQKNVTFES